MTTIFKDDFEAGNFQKWSYVQGASTSQGGPGAQYNYVSTGVSFGINPHGGQDVAQFYRPASATGLPHAKIFKEWSNVGKRDQFGRVEEKLPEGNPDGIYKAWYYLPADYQVTQSKWTNLFQFKEEGYVDGKWQQNPSWWLNMSSAKAWGSGGTEPVLFVNHWQNNWGYKPEMIKAPLGRWFEVRAELHENDRIEWLVDGKKLSTSYDSTWDVGRFYDKSDGWIFGVGHYDGIGKVWIDDVSVDTLPTGPTPTPTPTPTPIPTPTPTPPVPPVEPSPVKWPGTPVPGVTITGTGASETLKGGAANERFMGNGGDDTMVGGKGHDTYVVDSVGDKVIELAGEGTDQVLVRTWAHNMQANVENLVIERASGASVYGNALDNKIIGSAANDTIRGGQGADMMTGGGGNDVFVFRKGEAAGDVITDFRGNGTSAGDVLRFEGFGTGAKLTHVAEDWTVQYNGGSETFKLVGVTGLASGDVLFA